MSLKVNVRGTESAMDQKPGSMKAKKLIDHINEQILKFSEKIESFPGKLGHTIWEVGREDPRRVIHAVKVGLSVTLVSLLYLTEPLFKGISEYAIWAVMTVVVVLEFTAGATLCKGLNRGLGTLLAGTLAFFFEFLAAECGQIFRAIFIGTAVCVVGAAATYMRFIPYIKKNYDYGVVIFVLTFNLITVSSYRAENVLKIAHERFFTIAIGCGICLFMSLLIFPNWSGEELHSSAVSRLEGLADSIEACVNEYFNDAEVQKGKEETSEDTIYKGYKAVLDSKSTDETLALHASWEPRHSIHCHRCPWQQYVKLGAVLRQFGYTVVALHGCLRTEIQTPKSVRAMFKDPCIRLANEVSKALMELANSIRKRRHCSPEILSDHLHEALQDLNKAINSQPKLFLGSKNGQTTNMVAQATVQAKSMREKDLHQLLDGVSLSSVKTDISALLEWRSKRAVTEKLREPPAGDRDRNSSNKGLRHQSSKIAITSLEFSEALPLAAFASLLVEIVVKLDNVIEEVEELGRIACFKEFTPGDKTIDITCERTPRVDVTQNNYSTQVDE